MKNEYAKYYEDVSQKLSKMRLYKVAEECGISYGTLKSIEKGTANPTVESIEKLRAYLENTF